MTDGTGVSRPQFLLAALWALLAAGSFTVMIASVRYMDGKFDAFEIVFFRALVGVFIVIPLVSRSGFTALRTYRLRMHLVRTLFALFAMATLYYALAFIPIAQAVALTFLIPLFTTIAAGTVLNEKVGFYRWGATLGWVLRRTHYYQTWFNGGKFADPFGSVVVCPLRWCLVKRQNLNADGLCGCNCFLDEHFDGALDCYSADFCLGYACTGRCLRDWDHGSFRVGGTLLPGACLCVRRRQCSDAI